MTRKEKTQIEQRLLAKGKLRQFYRSYKYSVDTAIKYADTEIRGRLIEIENFFSPEIDEKRLDIKKKKFVLPFSFTRYIEFKDLKDTMAYSRNKAFKKAIKDVDLIYERQWFRNTEIFKMLSEGVAEYIDSLKNNIHLKNLCSIKGYVGDQSTLFRERRLSEAKDLFKEYKKMIKAVRRDMSVNNIDEHIKMYVDFFVQCQFRLDKFEQGINASLFDKKETEMKDMVVKKVKEEKLSMELPGWSLISKFD